MPVSLPSLVTPVLHLHQHRVAAAVHVEHFLAREADLHRPAEHQRRLAHHELVAARIALAAEAAAVRRGDDADLRRRHLQHARELAVQVVRILRAGREQQLAVAVERRRARPAAPSAGACCPRRRTGPRRRGPISPAPPRRRRTRRTGCGGCCPARRSRGCAARDCARPSSGEATVASGRYFTSISSSASTAVCSSSAITAATGSPT